MNPKLIIRLFQIAELAVAAFIVVLFSLSLSNQPLILLSYDLGRKFGVASLLLLGATLTPGILKRLGIIRPLMILLNPYKRHLGISTYITALGHYLLVTLLPSLAFGSFPPPLTQVSLFGLLAFLTMTPLFLTSNDYSIRLLKKNWTRLHKLVYLAALFINFLFVVGVILLVVGFIRSLRLAAYTLLFDQYPLGPYEDCSYMVKPVTAPGSQLDTETSDLARQEQDRCQKSLASRR